MTKRPRCAVVARRWGLPCRRCGAIKRLERSIEYSVKCHGPRLLAVNPDPSLDLERWKRLGRAQMEGVKA